jgi:hypothetical protein
MPAIERLAWAAGHLLLLPLNATRLAQAPR